MHKQEKGKNMRNSQAIGLRPGVKDMWNAFMVEGAEFSRNDIPCCPTDNSLIPKKLISFEDCRKIHKKEAAAGNENYHIDAVVHFYIDDQKFNGPFAGIWNNPEEAIIIIRHFDGMITPDFSTYLDFPDPIKRISIYMMRAFGLWATKNGVPVINNVRWGYEETWKYCWDGIPHNSIVAIGTVASGINKKCNRPLFEAGLFKMVETLSPKTIIVYGSARYKCFRKGELFQ